MTPAQIEAFLADAFPAGERPYAVEEVAEGRVRISQPTDERHLRPGGTVSGPTLMGLADGCAYVCVLAHLGPAALAVTSSLHIDFLRRPRPGQLVAEGELLKLGRSLAVVRVLLHAGGEQPVAAATVTYSLALLAGPAGEGAHAPGATT